MLMRLARLIPAVLLCGAALPAAAQDGTFRTWFEAPATVLPGEVFEVEMWASFEGDLLRPEGWFAGAVGSIRAGGDEDSFAFITTLTESMMLLFSDGAVDGNWLRDFETGQSGGIPGEDLDFSNPMRILAFEIGAGDLPGGLTINLENHSDDPLAVLGWSVDGRDDYVSTLDPNIALIATPSIVRVIPAPSSLGLLACAGLGVVRRRRSIVVIRRAN